MRGRARRSDAIDASGFVQVAARAPRPNDAALGFCIARAEEVMRWIEGARAESRAALGVCKPALESRVRQRAGKPHTSPSKQKPRRTDSCVAIASVDRCMSARAQVVLVLCSMTRRHMCVHVRTCTYSAELRLIDRVSHARVAAGGAREERAVVDSWLARSRYSALCGCDCSRALVALVLLVLMLLVGVRGQCKVDALDAPIFDNPAAATCTYVWLTLLLARRRFARPHQRQTPWTTDCHTRSLRWRSATNLPSSQRCSKEVSIGTRAFVCACVSACISPTQSSLSTSVLVVARSVVIHCNTERIVLSAQSRRRRRRRRCGAI